MGGLVQEEWLCGWREVDAIEAALRSSGLQVEVIKPGAKHAPAADDELYDESRWFCLTESTRGKARIMKSRIMLYISRTEEGEAKICLCRSSSKQDSLHAQVHQVLRAAGARQLPPEQPPEPPEWLRLTCTDAGGRYGLKSENVALLSVIAGALVAGFSRLVLLWEGWDSADASWALGLAVIIITGAWLGRRADV